MKRIFLMQTSVFIVLTCILCSSHRLIAGEVASSQKTTIASESNVKIVGPTKCKAGELVTLQADETGGACAWVAVPSVNFPCFQRRKDARFCLTCRAVHHVRVRHGNEGRCLHLCSRIAKWLSRTGTRSRTGSSSKQHMERLDLKKNEAPRPLKSVIEWSQTRCRDGKCYRIH